MGLQVRVRHALGDRLMELPDRDIDNPITVGRASGVEVQVPSVGVAPRHCVLFRFDGHWAVQDVGAANGGSTSGTFVNGQQVVEPVPLQIGDVISIGSDQSAPTIEVDPAAAAEGHTGWAGGDAVPAAAAGAGYPAPGYPAAGYGMPGAPGYAPTGYAPPGYAAPGYAAGYATGYAAPSAVPAAVPTVPVVPVVPSAAPPFGARPVAAPATWSAAAPAAAGYGEPAAEAESADQVDLSGFGAVGARQASSYRRPGRRSKPQTSQTAIAVGIIAALVIIGGTAWIVYQKTNENDVAVKPPPKKPVDDDSGHHSGSKLFGLPGSSGSSGATAAPASTDTTSGTPASPADTKPPTNPEPVATATPPGDPSNLGGTTPAPKPPTPEPPPTPTTPPTPATPPPPSAPPAAAAAGDEWQEMTDLHDSPASPALALFRFNDFQKQHPGQHADDLKQFMEDKFDRLWWDRIEQLMKKRDRLLGDVKKKENEIWDETNPVEKKREQVEKEDLEKKVKATKETLTVKMGYTEDEPPPADKAALAALRQKRDDKKYTEWKRLTLNTIINNKGKTDWEADD